MFRVLENRYGNKSTITVEILEELEKMPQVKGNQPRKVIDLIQSVEKALADLTELGNSGAINNPLVIKSIESKLPDFIKRDWLMFMFEPRNNVTSDNHFDMLLKFLKSQEEILERLEQLRTVEKMEKSDLPDKKYDRKIASTKTTKKEELDEVCGICGDSGHNNKIFFCRKFKKLKLPEKKAVLRKLGACRRCLGNHDEEGYCRDTFLCRNKDCKREGGAPDHHFFLCPKGEVKRGEERKSGKDCKGESKLTEEQEKILSELSPEMADRCRKAFTNTNKNTVTLDASGQSELLQRNGISELPVIMMLMQVTANAGQRIGTLIDLASDTNYITHKAAERLRLRSEKITLVVHGVGGMTMKVNTRRYLLKVRVKTPKGTERAHEMVCYGLDEIARVHQVIEPEKLKKFFPEVKLKELERPEEVELLISHREGRLAPQRVKIIGDLVLWESPLGKTVAGAHPDLFEEVEVAAYESKTHFARSMRAAAAKYQEVASLTTDTAQLQQKDVAQTKFTAASNREFLEWWHWDSIGAACEPKCGGCRCGNCPPGGKEMTLAEERELEIIKGGLTYKKGDAHTAAPHWDAKYPWTVDPASLPNNKGAVQACFLRMEKQLSREPDWKVAYATQINEMVERGAAIKLSNKIMDKWNGPVWYVSHLVAPNPHSVTTPVRFVESKAKLTPLDQKGEAVKAELCGAVFAARIRKYVEKHARMKIERWFHLLDSQTVLGAIQRVSYGYKTFFANRVGEIQKAGLMQDWWWIPGDLNIADIITRGGAPEDLKENSTWQNGPEFLKWPLEEWPIKSAGEVAAHARESVNKLQRKAFSGALTRAQARRSQQKVDPQAIQEIPKIETQEENPVVNPPLLRRKPTGWVKDLVEVRRFSSLSKLVRVIAWVCLAAKQWLKRKCRAPKLSKWEVTSPKQAMLTVKEHEDALKDLFLAAQEGISFSDTTLSRLAVYKDVNSGLLVCGGRIQTFNEDKTAVPVLPFEAWVSTLLARESHKANHEGVAGTLLRMRKKAWIIKGRRLAKKMVDSCVVCRKNKAKQCQQIMADLPLERTGPASPFEFTTMDLFGPYEVKDEVKKRARLRVWGIVFCCMASRAIHTEVVSDMSSEGFLLAYQRFTSLRGHPRKLWSDPGTNFVGARPALEKLHKFLDRLNRSELEDTAAKHGTEWSWKIHPADSPHRNGAAEAAVKVVKRALSNLGGDGVFTWGEFQTFLFMAANLANERPIDARTQSREDCVEYITPNSLLLGRANPKGDPGDFQFDGYPYKRLKHIQAELSHFWKKWSQLAGPNLFIRNKWHTKKRNVAVGDVVWLADQNALRGQYKLARVVSVNADSKGIVRDVLVKTFPSYPVHIKKAKGKEGPTRGNGEKTRRLQNKIPATILHRDVRRLVILLPAEEQENEGLV
uniref:uncharacterized protein LOC122764147 isoform X1 n=1 Tax=Solea senegalensis TaxID=28829 RepID=UPI001CD8E4BE|nr:uncharacterized protein LOC122764147 isoform X1 [Solea senegalensis]